MKMRFFVIVVLLGGALCGCPQKEQKSAQGSLGAACLPDSSCAGELFCEENGEGVGVCVEGRGQKGAPCFTNGTCSSTLVCRDDVCGEPLPAPSHLSASPGETDVSLNWIYSAGWEVVFDVYRREVGRGETQLVGTTEINECSFIDDSLELGVCYEFSVQARFGNELSAVSETVEASALRQPANWTLIYLISSDGDYPYDYWFNIQQLQWQGGTSDEVKVVALYDGFSYGDSRYVVVGDNDSTTESHEILTAEGSEVNMGDVKSYREFINWLLKRYPARNYMLSFHNHGGGAIRTSKHMLYDQTSGDSVNPDEQAEIVKYLAQETGHPVGLVESMTCLGQMVENTFGMAGHALYHVGAESLSYVTGTFPVVYLAENPNASPKDVARFLWEDHTENIQQQDVPCHWSVVDLDKMSQLETLLAAYTAGVTAFATTEQKKATVRSLAEEAQDFSYTEGDALTAYVDLGDFMLKMADAPTLPPEVVTLCQQIATLVDEELVPFTSYHNATHPTTDITPDYSNSHGISIYHPTTSRGTVQGGAAYRHLSFCEATGWGDYVNLVAE